MIKRNSTDGLPYFCKLCGKGFNEYVVCGEKDCELESDSSAKSRQKQGNNAYFYVRAADLKPGDCVYMHDNSLRTVKEVFHGHGLIPKGAEAVERPVQIFWVEGDFTMVPRSLEIYTAK